MISGPFDAFEGVNSRQYQISFRSKIGLARHAAPGPFPSGFHQFRENFVKFKLRRRACRGDFFFDLTFRRPRGQQFGVPEIRIAFIDNAGQEHVLDLVFLFGRRGQFLVKVRDPRPGSGRFLIFGRQVCRQRFPDFGFIGKDRGDLLQDARFKRIRIDRVFARRAGAFVIIELAPRVAGNGISGHVSAAMAADQPGQQIIALFDAAPGIILPLFQRKQILRLVKDGAIHDRRMFRFVNLSGVMQFTGIKRIAEDFIELRAISDHPRPTAIDFFKAEFSGYIQIKNCPDDFGPRLIDDHGIFQIRITDVSEGDIPPRDFPGGSDPTHFCRHALRGHAPFKFGNGDRLLQHITRHRAGIGQIFLIDRNKFAAGIPEFRKDRQRITQRPRQPIQIPNHQTLPRDRPTFQIGKYGLHPCPIQILSGLELVENFNEFSARIEALAMRPHFGDLYADRCFLAIPLRPLRRHARV